MTTKQFHLGDIPSITWGNSVHVVTELVEKSVKLTDAPDITWQRKAKYGPGKGRPYSIRFEYVRIDDGPWRSDITVYAQRSEAFCGDWFSPDKVIDPPQWLTDLIASAHPDAEAATR